MMKDLRMALISTGGTIEKTYCVQDGGLRNDGSVLDLLLSKLVTLDLQIERIALMDKDSLEMTAADHDRIAEAVDGLVESCDGIVVVHGTDRLTMTGDRIFERMEARGGHLIPVVLTGAMRPFELRSSDALQNMTEALLSARVLDPGVYCVMHGRILQFPGVVKDVVQGTFVRSHD